MKHLATLMCLMATITLFSCHQSDKTDYKAMMIGDWECIHEHHENQAGDKSDFEDHNIISFKSDGTFTDKYNTGVVYEGSWSLNGRDLTIDYKKAFENGVQKNTSAAVMHGSGKLKKITDREMTYKTHVTVPGFDGYLDITQDFIRK